MIRADRLSKTYGPARALTDLSLEVAQGETVGVQGPPGSGRSTLLKIVATLLPPSSGRLEIGGVDAAAHPYEVRRQLFWVGARGQNAPDSRAGDYLSLVHSTRRGRPIARVDLRAALAAAGTREDTRVCELSASERALLNLAAAQLSGADVVLIDDVFSDAGSDCSARCLPALREARQRGVTMLLALGQDATIPEFCSRVIELPRG